jgi:hypothetical protein
MASEYLLLQPGIDGDKLILQPRDHQNTQNVSDHQVSNQVSYNTIGIVVNTALHTERGKGNDSRCQNVESERDSVEVDPYLHPEDSFDQLCQGTLGFPKGGEDEDYQAE